MSTKLLYIGGCANGKIMETPDDHRIFVPDRARYAERVTAQSILQSLKDDDIYERMKIRSGDKTFLLMKLSILDDDDVIQLLIDHYSPSNHE